MCNNMGLPQTTDKGRASHTSGMSSTPKGEEEGIKADALALSTACLRTTIHLVKRCFTRLRHTTLYRLVTSTTQPAHVAAMIAVLITMISLNPRRTDRTDRTDLQYTQHPIATFLYITATAVHFGSQIWMTFCSGLSLYFNLPRHHFGEVQKVLFPLYFTMTSSLSLIVLVSRRQLTPVDLISILLAVRFATELLVRIYWCNPLVTLIVRKNSMEAKSGIGGEIGKISRHSQLFSCPDYVMVYTRFRRLHMSIAMANVACIGLSTAHLYYTAQQFHIVPTAS